MQAPAPLLKGKIAAKHLHELWFADLIDFTQTPTKSATYILVVQYVFSRMIWTEPHTQQDA